MDIDKNKIANGIKIPIIAGIIINATSLLLISFFAKPEADKTSIGPLVLISLITFAINFLLWLFTGYRSAKKFKASIIESGIISGLAYAIVSLLQIVIFFAFTILSPSLNSKIDLSNNFGSIATFGAFYSICQIGTTIFGFFINFGVGVLGGFFGQNKQIKTETKFLGEKLEKPTEKLEEKTSEFKSSYTKKVLKTK